MPGKVFRIVDGKRVYVRKFRPVGGAQVRRRRKLTKTVTKEVKRIARSTQETKYYAEQLLQKQSLDWAIHTYYDPSNGQQGGDILPLVPRIRMGEGTFQRDGGKVTPTKCRVDIEVALAETEYGLPPLASTNPYSNDIFVVMYIVRPKGFKNFEEFATSKAVTAQDFLDNGDGTSKGFGQLAALSPSGQGWYTNASDLQRPIDKDYFTLVKKKVVRLTKNVGLSSMDGNDVHAPNLGKSSWRGSMSFKLPTLRYDDAVTNAQYTGGYPTNSCMALMIGSCLTNGCDSLGYTEGAASAVLDNPIRVNVRTHYWYKDA